MTIRSLLAVPLAVLLVATGCQASQQAPRGAEYPSGPVTMTAGANPGSGFDLTIRSVVDALQKEHLVSVPLPVQNRPGGSGADFLKEMVEQHRGAGDQVSVTSLSMMVNDIDGRSPYGYDDVTMIARLMTEYFVVVTDPKSTFKNLADVLAAIKSDPTRVAVGAAHDDEAPFDLLVSAAGGNPAAIRYVTHEGGGDQIAALHDGGVAVALGGVSEFVDQITSGALRGLGVLAEDRLPGLDVPTAREQGLDVTLSNWRGLYGPPDMPKDAVAYWQKVLGEMVTSPTWKQTAEQSQFTTTFVVGSEFAEFLAKTQADVKAALTRTRQ